ncbi:MAG: N-acetylglucosaminyldiphosphoundecaprenol N-acetyl-beta-D-mannosaminyltransferase [Firmicutes bacterium]|nr:N-acetylglucosaminyldiphosphoundecaprenol N-acetyl-beta-D-mannosaminyltransferase [Bacillota bacterium]
MHRAVQILGVRVSARTMAETVEEALILVARKRGQIVTANAEIIYTAYRQPEFMAILHAAELVTADGMGVVLASRLLGDPVPERVSGYDLLHELARRAADLGLRVYLLGGKSGVAEKAADKLKALYPGINIVGTRHGYFADGESRAVIDGINSCATDLLLAALGMRGDYWLAEHKDALACAMMQVGGSFDVLAGHAARAPLYLQRAGLEWAYRLYKEPWRYKRMLSLPQFLAAVVGERCRRQQRREKP